MFKDRILLITGGTGSFGNAVLRGFLHSDIAEIRIFSRDEKKQDEMRHQYNSDKIKYYIGDVRDYDSLHAAMRGVDFAFSAAALKQVPSCEFYPLEAVRTNVLGTANTIEAAIANRVKNLVVLSTDKAVYPINAMGLSKGLAEKVMVAKSYNLGEQETRISATRYGNVMGSRGSVIPLFIQQIKAGVPLTVTDPNMSRFMMTMGEAVDLVLYAFQHAQQGDIFVQKAPAATILDLAETLLEIFGGGNGIQVIGTRHGEKRYETLLSQEEAARAVDLGGYYRIPADTRDLNYDKYFEVGDSNITRSSEYNSDNTHRLTRAELKDLLLPLDCVQQALTSH
jgi:UDP-glucose 4-epimerase